MTDVVAPKRRRRKAIIIAVVTVLALVLAAPVTYLLLLQRTAEANISRQALLPTAASASAVQPSTGTTAEDAKPLTVLILGNDQDGIDGGRSDVIMLAHVSADRQRVDLIHVPRDLYVPIPGHGKSKINAAYAWGGAPLLVETLKGILDIPIDHVAMMGFQGFTEMMDVIGGVDINVGEASPGFAVGPTHLDGEAALRYVRERKHLSQGDFSRGERQAQVMIAVMKKGLQRSTLTDPAKLARFIDAGTKYLTVDEAFDMSAMRSMMLELRDLRGDRMHAWTAPWTGVATLSSGASVVKMSERQMKVLAKALNDDTMDTYVDKVSPQEGWGS